MKELLENANFVGKNDEGLTLLTPEYKKLGNLKYAEIVGKTFMMKIV